MAAQDCIDALRKAAPDIDEDELTALVEELDAAIKARRAQSSLDSFDDVAFEEARKLGERAKIDALVRKRSAAINIVASQKRVAQMNDTGLREDKALSALLVGSERGQAGVAASVDAEAHSLEAEILGGLTAELRPGGLFSLLKRRARDFEKDVAREMWRITDGSGTPTGNKRAMQAAQILVKYQELARTLQNDAGAWVGKTAGYIVRQSHDQRRIAKAGFDAWRKTIEPLLNEKTFEGVKDRGEFLRSVWNNLSTGSHLKAGAGMDVEGFAGPSGLARRVSADRVLHFRSADDWLEYNSRFGAGSMMDAYFGGLRMAARNTALLRKFGTNPEQAFDADRKMLQKRAQDRGDAKAVAALQGWRMRAEWDAVTGAIDVPDNPSLAMYAAALRAQQTLAKLGGVVLSSFTDIALRSAALRHNGVGLLESYGSVLADTLRRLPSDSERRIAADLIGVGIDGLIGGVHARFTATDALPGKMSKAMDIYFRWNLLSWWTDRHVAAHGLALARLVALNKSKGYGALDADLQRSLGRYGIAERDWDAIRQSAVRPAEGKELITPDAIDGLSDDVLRTWLGRPDAGETALRRARRELSTKLRSFLVEESRSAMSMPGARERALMTFGNRPGTPMGELARFMGQFMAFPVTYTMRHLGREALRRQAADRLRWGDVDKLGISALIVGSTVLGYLSMTAKDIARGKEPRDPTDLKTWIAAFTQGGGAGIYGDFLFGQANRYGADPITTLLGPTAELVNSVVKVAYDSDDLGDAASGTFKLVRDNIPGANLFYARMALDYGVLYHVQEWLNPGYLKRMERRLKDETGQQFMFPPSQTVR